MTEGKKRSLYGELYRCPDCGTICDYGYWKAHDDCDVCPTCGWEGFALPMIAEYDETTDKITYKEVD